MVQAHFRSYLRVPLRWVLAIPLALQVGLVGLGTYGFVQWTEGATQSEILIPWLGLLGLVLSIGLGGWLLIYRWLHRSLNLLTHRITEIQQGHFSQETLHTHFPELDRLAAAITQMSLALQKTFQERETALNLALAAGEMGLWQRDLSTEPEEQHWSPEIYRQLGLDPEGIPRPSRQTFLSCVHPEDRHLLGKINWHQAKGSFPFQQEFRIVRANGEVRWLRSFGQAIGPQGGKVIKVFGINKDITQEKQQEAERQSTLEALQISEARLKALIDSLPFRVWARDPEGRLVIQNPVDIAAFGNCLGTTIEDLNLNAETYQEWKEFLARLQSGETIYRCYSETVNGETKHFFAIAAPVEEPIAGLGVIGISIDITEQVQAEEALQASEAKFRALVENLPFQVWARDCEGRLIFQSKSDQECYGNHLGQRIDEMNLSAEEISRWQETVARIMTGETIRNENITSRNGEEHVLFIGAPITQGKEIIGSLGVTINITEQRQVEANLLQTQTQLSLALQAGKMGVWEADLSSGRMWWSPDQYKILGFGFDASGQVLDSQGQVISPYPTIKLIWDHIHPDIQQDCDDKIQIALQTDQYPDSEYPYIRPDGKLRWIQFKGELILDDSGNPSKIVGVSSDVTERKEKELQLNQLAAIVNSSMDAIISVDLRGVILTWNEGAERTYGYHADEVLGSPLQNILPGTAEHFLASENPYISQHRRKDGRLIDVFITASILHDTKGDPCGTSWIVRDISYQQELERLKSEFVSIVSHELRTPLTAIHGSLTALNTGILGSLQPMGQELLHIAEQNTTRLIRLINDILDLERLDNPELPLDRQPCQCVALIAQACSVVQPLAEQAQVQIQQTLTDCTFWADPDLMLQVLTNLLGNGIKFSPPHSCIHISAQPQEGNLLIAIRDQGPGIPEDKLELIFERFQQVDASDARKKGGTGLGLAICRQIVQQHQGHIWAESRLGEGSVFFVTLPLRDGQDEHSTSP